MTRRQCAFRKTNGLLCGSPPLRDGDYCLMHDPEHAQEVQEARRLGGLRRRREVTVAGAYHFRGLECVADIRRLLEIAAVDTLGMENSITRARTLAYLAMVALKTLEVGELEDRLTALEQAVLGGRSEPEKVFDADQSPGFSEEERVA